MRLARIKGIDIVLSPVLIVLAVAVACSGFTVRVLMLVVVVFFHEVAHSLTAAFLGYRVEEIRLFPLGGSVRIGGLSGLEPIREALVALAGPAVNIMLAVFCLWLKNIGIVPYRHADFFIAVNTVIFLFNLLPALPVDGGRVLRSILSCKMGTVAATRAVHVLGRLTAGLLILTSLYRGLENPLEISMIAAAIFLFFAGDKERRMAPSLTINQVGAKESLLRKRGLLRSRTLVAAYNVSGSRVINCFVPGYYHIVFVVGEKGEVLGRVSEGQVLDGILRYGYNIRMEEIIKMHKA
ncbi:MAG: M50 family metallopeptidase [Bacillota bacterium]|nr:M50 family metallopeptidase [Bacillota bacterium]MDD3297842.1 M50 family metallopeptidase [Bacillota bacterium]MDD3851261.1 M50 family metallopeptidase [Bacillota bacterium]MDD4706965.1 M50 family metallopeptidase [Bacillota bacterium]